MEQCEGVVVKSLSAPYEPVCVPLPPSPSHFDTCLEFTVHGLILFNVGSTLDQCGFIKVMKVHHCLSPLFSLSPYSGVNLSPPPLINGQVKKGWWSNAFRGKAPPTNRSLPLCLPLPPILLHGFQFYALSIIVSSSLWWSLSFCFDLFLSR